jgi:hypothetical protein
MVDSIKAADAYAFDVLDMWKDIIKTRIEFRNKYGSKVIDPDIQVLYVNKLMDFWLELLPMIEGRREFGEAFVNDYLGFRKYRSDYMRIIFDKGEVERLEEMLRRAVHKLGITNFERGKDV